MVPASTASICYGDARLTRFEWPPCCTKMRKIGFLTRKPRPWFTLMPRLARTFLARRLRNRRNYTQQAQGRPVLAGCAAALTVPAMGLKRLAPRSSVYPEPASVLHGRSEPDGADASFLAGFAFVSPSHSAWQENRYGRHRPRRKASNSIRLGTGPSPRECTGARFTIFAMNRTPWTRYHGRGFRRRLADTWNSKLSLR